MEPIVNKVAESAIEVFNLEPLVDFEAIAEIDISQFLDRGIVLREKEFRQSLKVFDWSQYESKHVAIVAPELAIIPTWAYMLISSKLLDVASSSLRGSGAMMIQQRFRLALDNFDWEAYRDKIVVVKGCGSDLVPEDAYAHATTKLQTVARKIMFGEPCSSVPIWRKPMARRDSAEPAKVSPMRPPNN